MLATCCDGTRPSTLQQPVSRRLPVIGLVLPVFAGLHAQVVPSSGHQATERAVPGAVAVGAMMQVRSDTVTIDAPFDQAWTALLAVYEQLNLPVALHDAAANQLGTGNYRVRRNRIGKEPLSRYLDCGEGPSGEYANVYSVRLELLTTLWPMDTDRTVLLVDVQASAKPRSVSGHALPGTPNRRLAQRLGELVAEQLGMES